MNLKSEAIKATRKWITKEFGKRCKVYSPGCPSCDKWSEFDQLFRDWEAEYEWMKRIKKTLKGGKT